MKVPCARVGASEGHRAMTQVVGAGAMTDHLPLFAVVPDDIALDLVRADLAKSVPTMRGQGFDAARIIVNRAVFGGASLVALARTPGAGRAVALLLGRRGAEPGRSLRLSAKTPSGEIEIAGDADLAEVAALIDRLQGGPAIADDRRDVNRGSASATAIERKVFVIHGRDEQVRSRMFSFLRAWGWCRRSGRSSSSRPTTPCRR
jgi:hypothetical protein